MSTIKSSAENLTLNADGSGNDISIQSNAAEKLKLTAEGNLHLQGSDSRIQLNAQGGANTVGNNTVHVRGDAANMKLMTADGGDYIYEVNGSEKMRLKSDGNVGIGDTDPSEAKLSITGVQAGDVGIKIDHDIVDTHAFQIAADTTTARGVDVECNALTTGHVAKFYSNSASTSTRQVFVVKNDHAQSTGTTALYVDNDSTGLVADFKGAGGIRSASGIKFGTDTAAANTLSDYEEGTWTASVAFGGNVAGQSYDNQSGWYVKVGGLVMASCNLDFGAKGSSTGAATLIGLPFASSIQFAPSWGYNLYVTFQETYQGRNQASSVVELTQTSESGTPAALTHSNFQNNSRIVMTMTYRTTA